QLVRRGGTGRRAGARTGPGEGGEGGEVARWMGTPRSKRPPCQRYRAKPAVRNDRGDRGDVGIIRSPVRASVLPDRSTLAPSRARSPAKAAAKRRQRST